MVYQTLSFCILWFLDLCYYKRASALEKVKVRARETINLKMNQLGTVLINITLVIINILFQKVLSHNIIYCMIYSFHM